MATITASDISFLLSGGSGNVNPALSLGGSPSATQVSGNLNSLFSDVAAEAAEAGSVDYRCFYIKNNSEYETLYDSSVHVHLQTTGGAYGEIGVQKRTEVQKVLVSGSPISGTVDFKVGDAPFSAEWGGSPESFAASLSSSMSLAGLDGAEVSYSYESYQHTFTVSFSGSMDNRAHPLIEVLSINLAAAGPSAVGTTRVVEGSPINTVAPVIATAGTSPSGVTFSQTSASSRISIGDLAPGDSFPVWIRRTTPAGTAFKESDSMTIRLSGDPFGPPPAATSSSSSSSFVCPITWTVQPADEQFNWVTGAEFNFQFTYTTTGGSPGFQYSEDGSSWQDFAPDEAIVMSGTDPLTGISTVGGTFRVTAATGAVRYRVKVSVGGVGNQSYCYSDQAFAICAASECSEFWPAGYSGPTYSADCGLLPMPGYTQEMDCRACRCVSTPTSSSSS